MDFALLQQHVCSIASPNKTTQWRYKQTLPLMAGKYMHAIFNTPSMYTMPCTPGHYKRAMQSITLLIHLILPDCRPSTPNPVYFGHSTQRHHLHMVCMPCMNAGTSQELQRHPPAIKEINMCTWSPSALHVRGVYPNPACSSCGDQPECYLARVIVLRRGSLPVMGDILGDGAEPLLFPIVA